MNEQVTDYLSILWDEKDKNTAKARFIHNGINVGGTFHLTRKGEYIRFTTDERLY